MREDKSVVDAKKCLKSHIKFFESMIKHINGDDIVLKGRAMWTAYFLHNYINGQLMKDIVEAMTKQGEENGSQRHNANEQV
jgi:hypothetical protein